MESDEALWDLYCRWCGHHKIHRTPEEMKLAFRSFKKSATFAFKMSQKDPTTIQFCLSIWCDETDTRCHEVKIIPTERDLKSGNALLGLYHRYCRAYRIKLSPKEMQHRFYFFKKSVYYVIEKNKMNPFDLFCLSCCCDKEDTMHDEASAAICVVPTFRDLGSDEAVMKLYRRWSIKLRRPRIPEEMGERFNIFKNNAIQVFEMNQMYPSCRFHLSSFCDKKDLFDPSCDEEINLTPTEKDLESDEAVWDLYYRWCRYHTLLRTPEEMQQRFNIFKRSACYAVKMNQKEPTSNSGLSMWCDKIELPCLSFVKERTLAPTKVDLESDEALWDLYRRWCGHHKIHRTPEEMKWAFMSFKKSATYAFEMSQKDPTAQFCLSIWCDETDTCSPEVKIIPTERDLKSGNALLGLYHRYCHAYRIKLSAKEMQQRFYFFKKSVYYVIEKNKMNPFDLFCLSCCCDKEDTMHGEASAAICVVPTFRDLGSDEAVMKLYRRWSIKLRRPRTTEEMGERFNIFKNNAIQVFEMNQMYPSCRFHLSSFCDEKDLFDPSCRFHLSSFCDEKDLFDPSFDEEINLTPTEKDLESDEAVWDLYYRWCLYHTLLRTPKEMEQRFGNFKMSTFYAVKMNQKGPTSNSGLSMWCDKIDLRYPSFVDERTLAPTKGDMESDEALWDLYRRWCGHHKIHRTPEEMKWAFMSFKKSATYAFEMSQKDPTAQFCLSIWCDETDTCSHEVKIIPTERDLKSGNALLGLYHRYCRAYRIKLSSKEMQQRFYFFKKSVYYVIEKNKMNPFDLFCLSYCCDKEDTMHDKAAMRICTTPTFWDLGSYEAVMALYRRWLLARDTPRYPEEMDERLNTFKNNAIQVFEMNQMDPSYRFHLSSFCDEKDLFDPSRDEEINLTPTEEDLESEAAVWDLYHKWCRYHTLLRTPEEMEQRFNNFKKSALYAVKMNQKDPSSNSCLLSIWCDKIDLRYPSGVEEMTLAPTKGDMESDEALWELYRRWLDHHKIHRTPKEMKWAFMSFKKSATYAFEMSQKDPTVQFCLSMWCDETDICVHQVKIIPTERDLESGNALLGLYDRQYHIYCAQGMHNCAYLRKPSPELRRQRFYYFKKSVYQVFEKNKGDPVHPFYLGDGCDEEDTMLDKVAKRISTVPTFRDLGSDKAVSALYRRWCLERETPRTLKQMRKRFPIFKITAQRVFRGNVERPGTKGLTVKCDCIF